MPSVSLCCAEPVRDAGAWCCAEGGGSGKRQAHWSPAPWITPGHPDHRAEGTFPVPARPRIRASVGLDVRAVTRPSLELRALSRSRGLLNRHCIHPQWGEVAGRLPARSKNAHLGPSRPDSTRPSRPVTAALAPVPGRCRRGQAVSAAGAVPLYPSTAPGVHTDRCPAVRLACPVPGRFARWR